MSSLQLKLKNQIQYKIANFEMVQDIYRLTKSCGLSLWMENDYREELNRNDSRQIVSVLDQKIIGIIILRLINKNSFTDSGYNKFEEAEILTFGVSPGFQNKGIGNNLLDKALKDCANFEVKEIWLEVRESNYKAINFYQKNKFFFQYIRQNYYQNPFENALIMKKDLE